MELINTILFWTAFWLLAWNAYFLIFNKGIPNIRTAPAIRKKIIALLKEDFTARECKNYTIIDLGSGNGKFARQIARALPDARVIGIEISPLAYHPACWLKKLFRLHNLEFKRSDFFAYDLSEADAVVMYLNIYFMEKIGQKLHAEVKPGTLITSNHFKLGAGWEPVDSPRIQTLYPHQRTLHVYRKK